MVFVTTTADALTICGVMHQALIGTDDWTDGDASYANGFVAKHTDTGEYVAFTIGWLVMSTHASYPDRGFCGIKIIFSSEWDAVNHLPSGTIKVGAIPIAGNPTRDTSDSAYYWPVSSLSWIANPYAFETRLHIDKYGVIGYITNNTPTYGISTFFVLEVVPDTALEYDDGNTPIFFTCYKSTPYWGNNKFYYDHEPGDSYGAPIANNNPSGSYITVRANYLGTVLNSAASDYLLPKAYRSTGNNKIMFEFPYFDAIVISGNYRAPVFHTRRWFPVAPNTGLASGDIINWLDEDNITVHKFIVVNPWQTTLYAMPYQTPYEY